MILSFCCMSFSNSRKPNWDYNNHFRILGTVSSLSTSGLPLSTSQPSLGSLTVDFVAYRNCIPVFQFLFPSSQFPVPSSRKTGFFGNIANGQDNGLITGLSHILNSYYSFRSYLPLYPGIFFDLLSWFPFSLSRDLFSKVNGFNPRILVSDFLFWNIQRPMSNPTPGLKQFCCTS